MALHVYATNMAHNYGVPFVPKIQSGPHV